MGVYDQAARYATQEDAEPIVQRLVRGLRESLQFRDWVESRTTPKPGERDRTADRVAALEDAAASEQPWLLLMEFQAQHDPDKLDVTLIEAGRLRQEVRHGPDRKGKYKVLTAIVYLVGHCRDTELDMTIGAGYGTNHKPVLWNVEADEAGQTLEDYAAGRTSWGILFWIALMHGGGDPLVIARWRELVEALPDAHQRSDLVHIALIFAELAGCYLAWEQVLKGFQMTESQVVNRWMAEAELKRARAYLLRVLGNRFPGQVLPEIADTINSQPSLTLLDAWMDAASTATTFEQFLAVLRQ